MKTREELEEALLENVRQRQTEWIRASDEERDEARKRFIDALRAFNSLVVHYKIPDSVEGKGAHVGLADGATKKGSAGSTTTT